MQQLGLLGGLLLGCGGQFGYITAILPESLAEVFRPLRVVAGEASLGLFARGIVPSLIS